MKPMASLCLLGILALTNPQTVKARTHTKAPLETNHLVVETPHSILLKDPFGGHYEEIINIGARILQGDNLKIPAFQGKKQGTAPWCWAASAAMMLYHTGLKKDPCTIASEYLRQDCCSWTSKLLGKWDCWKGGDVAGALRHYGMPTQTFRKSHHNAKQKEELVINELKKGKPSTLLLECTNFKDGPGRYKYHAVVVYGASNLNSHPNSLKFLIYDPLTGPTATPVATLDSYKNDHNRGACSYRWHSTLILNPKQ